MSARWTLALFLALTTTAVFAVWATEAGDRVEPEAKIYALWQCWDVGTTDPCQQDLKGIEMISATDGWAVGGNGTALRWNGSAWPLVEIRFHHDPLKPCEMVKAERRVDHTDVT